MTGGQGVVGVKQIAENIKRLESEAEHGRFSMENSSATPLIKRLCFNKKQEHLVV